MGEEIAFENGRISNFEGLVTLTLDRVILHTVMHHLSTSTYIPNFIEIKETFCGRTDGHLRPTLLGWIRGDCGCSQEVPSSNERLCQAISNDTHTNTTLLPSLITAIIIIIIIIILN